MFDNFLKKLKQNSEKKKFKTDIEKEHKKLFLDNRDKSKFKKRRKISIKLPNIKSKLDKKSLYIIYIVVAFVIVGAFVIFMFSPFFYIKNIYFNLENKSAEKVVDLNILYSYIDRYRNKNILFTDRKEVEDMILNYQKNILSAKTNKNVFKGTLNIEIVSYEPVFYINVYEKKYYITENGVFVPAKNDDMGQVSEIKVSFDENELNFIDYKQILKQKQLQKIIYLKEGILKNIPNLYISDIYYFKNEREVHFDVNNGLKLIFDLELSLDEQIKKIGVFNSEHDITVLDNLVYIDLRVLSKIFFCERENKGICLNNLSELYEIYK